MDEIVRGFFEALRLIFGGDLEVRATTLRTIAVSGAATAIAMLLGVPAGYLLARRRFPGRTLLLGMVNTAMGMPPVVAGLFVWLMLIRSGPFGHLELIYTKQGMALAQIFIATPLIVGCESGVRSLRAAERLLLGWLLALMRMSTIGLSSWGTISPRLSSR